MKQILMKAITILAISTTVYAEENLEKGKKVFRKCKACHSIEEGKKKLGPSLFGIFGREAGAVEGFRYSKPMAAADFVWNEETLNNFLKNPKKYMKGTKMSFPGVRKEADMANLLAYLKTL